MLPQMIQRLTARKTFEDAVETILDDVIALHGSEFGNVQLPIGKDLVIAAQRGLPASFLNTFKRVDSEDGSACGRALLLGTQVVIRDIEADPDYAVFLDIARRTGYRAVQTTPMVTKEGVLLGLVSTHFAGVHEPTPIEMRILKQYSGIAADYAFGLLGSATIGTRSASNAGKAIRRRRRSTSPSRG